MEPPLLEVPKKPWMDRLRKGHWIYLAKEKEYARVTWAWEPPEPGTCSGRIPINRYTNSGNEHYYRGQQTWFVNSMGTGFDGKQLIVPCESNLPDNPPAIPEPDVRRLERALQKANEEISFLKRGQKLLGAAYVKVMEEVPAFA